MRGYNCGMIETMLPLSPALWATVSAPKPAPLLEELATLRLENAALAAYEDAGIHGLCAEGRWEAALAAIRHVDLSDVLESPVNCTNVDESA